MRRVCVICGNPCYGTHCFRHKPKQAIKKTFLRKKVRWTPLKKTYKPKAKSKEKIRSVRYLKPILWTIFSKFVRLRDSDKNGYVKCITCPNVDWWKFSTAGHYRRRRHNSTFVHEKNGNGQCETCNCKCDGMEDEHGRAIDLKYGEGTAEMLTQLSREYKKFTADEIEELITHYTAEVDRLLKEKNL